MDVSGKAWELWGSILGLSVASGIGKARKKTAGCTDGSGGAETAAAREHGRSVKLMGIWWEGWKPESEGAPRKSKDLWARTNWVGSGGAAEAGDGTPAPWASVWKAVELGVGNAKL